MARKKKEKKSPVVKAGTKIIIHTGCNYAGCDERHPMTLEADMTEDELQEWANEMALETVQPEGYFTIAGEDDDE